MTEPAPPRQGRLRRSPRFSVFIGTGIAVALGVALLLTLTVARPEGRDGVTYGLGAVFGYLGVLFALVGALAGGALALLVGWLAARRR